MKKVLINIYSSIADFIQQMNRLEKAAVLTLFSLLLILGFLTSLHLSNHTKEELIEIIPADEEFVDIEELKELEKQQELEEFFANAKATSQAYNQADRDLKHSDDDFKTLDELITEREMQQSREKLLTNIAKGQMKINEQDLKLPEQKANSEKKEETVNKNSFVRYNLVDREAVSLPNPIYTCDASGKVVINIIVNADGKVVDLQFNADASNTKNGCLVENALSYARKAHFSANPNKEKQLGSITYFFQ